MIKLLKHGQVSDDLKKKIISGELSEGDFLPPESRLMEHYSCSRNTIRTALRELENQGFLEKRRGSPSRIKNNFSRRSQIKIAWLGLDRIGDEFYFSIFSAASVYASTIGITLDYVPLSKPEFVQTFLGRLPEYTGCIYSSMHKAALNPADCLKLFKFGNLVGIDAEEIMLGESYVCTDNACGMTMAARYLADTGHRHILLCGRSENFTRYKPFVIRRETFSKKFLEFGGKDATLRELQLHNISDLYRFRYLLKEKITAEPEIDAVVALSDSLALECIWGLNAMELKVPEDVSVMGFDGSWHGEQHSPALTTIRQPAEEIGRQAVDMVLRRAGIDPPEPEQLFIKPELVIRESVKKRN